MSNLDFLNDDDRTVKLSPSISPPPEPFSVESLLASASAPAAPAVKKVSTMNPAAMKKAVIAVGAAVGIWAVAAIAINLASGRAPAATATATPTPAPAATATATPTPAPAPGSVVCKAVAEPVCRSPLIARIDTSPQVLARGECPRDPSYTCEQPPVAVTPGAAKAKKTQRAAEPTETIDRETVETLRQMRGGY